ncbi:hypothetical protein E9993_14700 [Labilibacter sediminis]|nr:hypothetical protein E9993_14700 [Labilibacter sediminis]
MCKDKTNHIEKQLKVTRQPQGKKYVPGFRLAGQYMDNLGYKEGDFVDVVAAKDIIIIKKQSAQNTSLTDMIDKNPVLLSLMKTFDLTADEGI